MKKTIFALLSAALFTACQPQPEAAATETTKTETTIDNTEVELSPLNTDSLATAQMALRGAIEAKKESLTLKSIKTDSLREQVAQKWSLMHFYFDGEQLVRVKSYPHGTISTRTEEFYFDNGNLIAAVIEDDGLSETGEEAAEDDKAYYFYEGKMVKEVNNTSEEETGIRDSDAERLLQEANEYMELAKKL